MCPIRYKIGSLARVGLGFKKILLENIAQVTLETTL